jgi:hypothetical protein
VTKDQRKLVIAWNNLVTLKVVILAWRLFQNRILSKDNLFKRGVLNKSQSGCGMDVEWLKLLLIYFLNAIQMSNCGKRFYYG